MTPLRPDPDSPVAVIDRIINRCTGEDGKAASATWIMLTEREVKSLQAARRVLLGGGRAGQDIERGRG